MNEEVSKNPKHKEFQKLGYGIITFTDREILGKLEMIEEILNDLVNLQSAKSSFDYPGFTYTDD